MARATPRLDTAAASGERSIRCRLHLSGFEKADSNFYSMSLGSEGRVYFTLSSHDIDTHGRVYRYDPAADSLEMLCDLGQACGETGAKCLPQGKSHSPFFEVDGWMYLATQYGFFASTGDREEIAPPPQGYKPYPGGHILRIHMKDGRVEDLAKAPPEEGVLAMNMDTQRGLIWALTWPKGLLLRYDAAARRLRCLGPVSRGGEFGRGDQYFCLMRSFALDPRDGAAYFTNPDGQVYVCRPGDDQAEAVGGLSLRRDILGAWDPHKPGHQGYNWRDIQWHEGLQCFFGVHPRSGWLFRFDPRAAEPIQLMDRIVADELRRNGRFEPFRYGYLTLRIGPGGRTLYYLTGVHDADPQSANIVQETPHLVTFELESGRRQDHGAMVLENGWRVRMCQCLAVHPGGRLYTTPWLTKPASSPGAPPGKTCDLVSFENPLPCPNQ